MALFLRFASVVSIIWSVSSTIAGIIITAIAIAADDNVHTAAQATERNTYILIGVGWYILATLGLILALLCWMAARWIKAGYLTSNQTNAVPSSNQQAPLNQQARPSTPPNQQTQPSTPPNQPKPPRTGNILQNWVNVKPPDTPN